MNINFEDAPIKKITNPEHYHKGSIDVISFLEQHFPESKYTVAEGFFIGNAIKYICRHEEKNGSEDLIKAIDYIHRLIEMRDKR